MKNRLFILVCVVTVSLLVMVALTNNLSKAQEITEAPSANNITSASRPPLYGNWQVHPQPSPFNFTRIDAEYSLETGHVYILGGRLSTGSTDGRVWEFNPVTGVYTDTGVDMPTPVSNYLIARLTDSNGYEVMVTFGSRPAAGGTTNVVQGYYPVSNTVVTFVSDTLPVSTAPGGVVVVDNLAYVFGGFDGVATIDDTFIFDITAAPGSRWTTGPNLSQPRSYIAAAAIDGVIYAMGGDDFDGSDLIALTITEKLDTANPTSWDDAGVAEMPIACDEAPGFGFDSNSGYDLANTFVFAGCGQWSSEIAESMLYFVVSDTWDVSFPDLNEARRNHAGAFVPTGDGSVQGNPGMWLFGGRQESDATVLNVVEFYNVTPLSDFTLSPQNQTVIGRPGWVDVTMAATNLSGLDDTFDVSYSGTNTWPITGPLTVTVPNSATVGFTFQVDMPNEIACDDLTEVTIQATGQISPGLTDTALATVQVDCFAGFQGTVVDANTGLGVPNAFLYMELITDTSVTYDTFADQDGNYSFDVPYADYQLAVSGQGYRFSLLDGWLNPPLSALQTITYNVVLSAPVMSWSVDEFTADSAPGGTVVQTLVITNSGTADLNFALDTFDTDLLPPPPPTVPTVAESGLPKVDAQILHDLAAEGTAEFIIMMADQADLSEAYAMTDWDARGVYVYNTLVAHAAQSQADVKAYLDSQGVSYHTFVSVNGLLVNGDAALVDSLAARTDVGYLVTNGEVALEKPSLNWQEQAVTVPLTVELGVSMVNADDVWNTYQVTGTGIVVANIDTGVEWTHSALTATYRGNDGDHNYNWYHPTSPDGCDGSLAPCDNDGHGTHTMGTMVGDDGGTNQIGVAPGANWIACKGCEGNGCSFDALLMCADWTLAPTDLSGLNPDPSQRPNIVNNSWGGGGGDFWYAGAVTAWRASGIFPQFSGGNSGPSCSVSGSPGDYGISFSAAALISTTVAADFSSRGPAAVTGILKPDISAPGVDVRSSVPGNGYALLDGTSMASPHVAGVVALVWSADPELIGQVDQTMWLLQQTATPLYTTDGCGGDTPTSYPNNTYGWGLVDAATAVSVTLSGDLTPSWATMDPAGGVVAPGETITVEITFNAPDTLGVYTGTLRLTADEPYNSQIDMPLQLNVMSYSIYLPILMRPD